MAKVMISLPDELLSAIDERAQERELTRSGFLAELARRELTRAPRAQMEKAVQRLQAAFSEAGRFDAGELVREERDARR